MSDNSINKIAQLAKNQQEQSAQTLKHQQSHHQDKQTRLEQLLQFRQEYEQRLSNMGDTSIAARQLQDYRQFLTRLNQAIDQQHTDISKSQADVETARQAWIEKSQRHSALERLVAQADERLRQQRDKAEQNDADEKTLSNYHPAP